jgi:hypothetical protein
MKQLLAANGKNINHSHSNVQRSAKNISVNHPQSGAIQLAPSYPMGKCLLY